MAWLKENWFLVVFGAAVVVAYIEVRLPDVAKTEIGAIKAVKPETVQALKEKHDAFEKEIRKEVDDNNKYIEKTEDKVERIVQILLEE